MFGSIEFGGTKIRCAIIDENGNLIDQIRISTSKPEINIKEIEEFYKNKKIAALGVGAFGPIDINKNFKILFLIFSSLIIWLNF